MQTEENVFIIGGKRELKMDLDLEVKKKRKAVITTKH